MNFRRVVCVAVLCASLVTDPLRLQGQQVEGFGEVLDVRVTNVDVIATDSRGNPVAGLTRADFEIYEDGKRQEITNFYEVTATSLAAARTAAPGTPATPAPASTRKFIFYVDNGTLSVKNRNEIFPALAKFIETNLLPGDQAMIVTWNRALQVRLPWTSDPAAIATMLKTISGELGAGAELQAEKRRVERMLSDWESEAKELQNPEAQGRKQKPMVTFEMLEGSSRAYAENVRHDVAQSVAAMTKLLASLSGVDGKKVLILATESLPTQAGSEMFAALETIRGRAMVDVTSSLRAGANRGSGVGDLGKFNITPIVEGLARAANATGVTVYAINPKGTDTQNSGKVELQQPSETETEFASSVQALDGVNILAQRTGGRAMIGAPASMALSALSRDLSSHYSIGYRAHSGTPDRKVEIRTTRPGVKVRSRNTIYYRSLENEMADRVLANHLQSNLLNSLKVSLEADAVSSDGSRRLLPMRVIIPADSLTLVPDADGNVAGGFSVFTSAGNANGGGTGVNVQSQTIKWPAAQAAQMKGRRIGFAVQVPVDTNPTQISVGVVDHLSQTQGFATLKLQ